MGHSEIKKPHEVNTAAVVSLGLVGGWLTARESGIRPLGGVVLLGAGVWAARTWWAKRGPLTAAALSALYIVSFGVSHPLAKKIGAWPSVLAVTGVAAGVSHCLVDKERCCADQ